MDSGARLLRALVMAGVFASLCDAVPASAEDRRFAPHSAEDAARLARQNGLVPYAHPSRRGGVFEVDGVDEAGEPTHVVIDAVTGDLLWRTHRGVAIPNAPRLDERVDRIEPVDAPPERRFGASPKLKAASAARPRDARRSRVAVRQARRPQEVVGPGPVANVIAMPIHASVANTPRPILVRNPLALPGTPPTETARQTAGAPVQRPPSPTPQAFVPVAPLE